MVLSQYDTDDRADIVARGARIVCELANRATQAKLDPRFTQTIEPICAMGFKPDYLHYMRAFDLPRSDSVTAASPAAATPHIPVDPISPVMIVPLGAPIGLRRSKSLTGKPGARAQGSPAI
jgi:hypothetical protein